MKVLFLDFDGVLNPYLYSNALYKMWATHEKLGITSRDKYGDHFAPWCVDELKNIIDFTDCKIVVSSSWRVYVDDMKAFWKYRGLPGECIGITPVGLAADPNESPAWNVIRNAIYSAETTRGLEVKAWLDQHPEVTKFAILDDINEFKEFGAAQFVKTDQKFGLTRFYAEKVIELLL